MDCAYTESLRKAIAKLYRDFEAASAARKSIGFHVEISGGQSKTQQTIDGKEVVNPLMEALNNGQCKISGYR